MSAESVATTIAESLREVVPGYWDGKKSVLRMRDEGSPHWRQMEWIGWFFEHLCHIALKGVLEMPGPRYGNVTFDGFAEAPWDFKAHAIQSGSKLIVNDQEAIDWAVEKYGWVGLILASGEAVYDDERRTFQAWHNNMKGGYSQYERDRVARGAKSRIRKAAFTVKEILVLRIDADHVREAGSFQSSFRNSNGAPRRQKMLIDTNDVSECVLEVVCF